MSLGGQGKDRLNPRLFGLVRDQIVGDKARAFDKAAFEASTCRRSGSFFLIIKLLLALNKSLNL